MLSEGAVGSCGLRITIEFSFGGIPAAVPLVVIFLEHVGGSVLFFFLALLLLVVFALNQQVRVLLSVMLLAKTRISLIIQRAVA